MYVQEITLQISPDLEMDLMLDEFNWLMSNFHKNGQVANGGHTQFIVGQKIVSMPYTPEKDSLEAKHHNSFVVKQIERLETLCQSKLQIRTIGADGNHAEVCSCKSSSSHLLGAFCFSRDSAVICGDCRLIIPLYRLPKTEDDSYLSIINWQLSTMVLDGFETINLKNNGVPNISKSHLNALDKLGFEVCERLEKLTGVKTRLLQTLGSSKLPSYKNSNKKKPGEELFM